MINLVRKFGQAEKERQAEIARTTASEGWDYILEMILVPLAEARENCTQLRGERLIEQQARVATLQQLLDDVGMGGGRVDYEPPNELDGEDETFTDDAYEQLGVARIGSR